jgi:hypothetical protein
MNNSNQTERIGRYLSGAMSADEETRFNADLIADPGLRRMLDAEELIRGTIRRDLDALPSDHPATRAHVMGTLAFLSEAARTGALPDMKGGASALPHSGSIVGSGALKVAAGVILGAGLAAGGFALFSGSHSVQPERSPAPHVEQYQAPAPQAPKLSSDTGMLQPEPQGIPAETSVARPHVAPSAKVTVAGSHHEISATPKLKTQQSVEAPPNVSETSTSQGTTTTKRPPVVTHKDPNVRLQMQVEKPKVVKPEP